MSNDDDVDPNKPEVPEHLKDLLIPEKPAEDYVVPLAAPPGHCKIHGDIGWKRYLLIADGEIVSQHCMLCVSRIFTALVGDLNEPEE